MFMWSVVCGGVLLFILYFLKRNSGADPTASDTQNPDEPLVNQTDVSSQMAAIDVPDTSIQKEPKPLDQISQQKKYEMVRHSLQELFECIYTQLVLPSYTTLEDRASQPLYNALLTEYKLAVDIIICKVSELDLIGIILNGIPIITQHLHNARKSDGSSAFSSMTDEINVLRDFSKALIRNFLPQHIWEQKIYHCVLQEILATKALDLVALLSDPDTLNQQIVTQLDEVFTNPMDPKLQILHRGYSLCSMIIEDIDIQQDDKIKSISEDDKPKKKDNFLKYYYHKVIKRHRQKKKTKPRCVYATIETDGENSDGDMVDSDDKSYNLEEKMFSLFYVEVWKAGKWTVTVTSVQKDVNELLLFIIHLEESNQPDVLRWDVEITQSEINDFYSYCKDTHDLPSISTIIEYSATDTEWDEENARKSLEAFLQVLVTDPDLSSSELVCAFLCPLHKLRGKEQYDKIWDLLTRIAYFLTSGLEEDDKLEELKLKEKQDEIAHHHEPAETQSINKNRLGRQQKDDIGNPECFTACTSERNETAYTFERFELRSSDDDLKHLTSQMTRQAACLSTDEDDNITDSAELSISANADRIAQTSKKTIQSKSTKIGKEQKHDYKVIFDLLEELSGKSNILKMLRKLYNPFRSWLNKQIAPYLNTLNLSEDQIAACIDNLCKYMCPENDVQSPRSKEDKDQTKGKALQLITSKCFVIISKTNLETTFKIFQNAEENKKLVYKLLSHLLKELMPGEFGLDVTSKLNVKHLV